MSDFKTDYQILINLEKEYNLYSFQFNNEYVWPYLRNKIYGLIHQKYITTNSTQIVKGEFNSFDRNSLLSYNLDNSDAIIFNFHRKELNEYGLSVDPRTKILKDKLDNEGYSYKVVNFSEEGLYENNTYGEYYIHDLVSYYENLNKYEELAYDKAFASEIENRINNALAINFNIADYVDEISRKVASFHEYFYYVFSQIKPKFIFLTSNYMRNEIIIPAKKLNIKIYEIQYATITPYHNGYHYDNALLPTYVDGILFWSKYFSDFKYLAQNVTQKYVLGYENTLIRTDKNDKYVSIISQNLMSEPIIRQTIKLAQSNPQYQFHLKLHPNEFLTQDFVDQITSLNNLNISSESINSLLNKSKYVLGVSSSVLYDAVQSGCRVLIMDGYMSCFSQDLIDEGSAFKLDSFNLEDYEDYDFNTYTLYYEAANEQFQISNLLETKYDTNLEVNSEILDELITYNKRLVSRGLIDVSDFYTWSLAIKSPLVSIVIPNYNGAKFILKLLKSIRAISNHQLFKIIIVDDCSTDNSLAIIEDFKDSNVDMNIEVIKTEYPSGGPGLPRNIGVKHNELKYTYFIDNDDYLNALSFTKALYLMESRNLDYIRLNALVKFSDKLTVFSNRGYSDLDLLTDSPFLWNGIYLTKIIHDNEIHIRNGIAEDFNFNVSYLHLAKNRLNLTENIIVYFKENSNISLDHSFESIVQVLDNHIDSASKLVKYYDDKKIINIFVNRIIIQYLFVNTALYITVNNYNDEQIKIIKSKFEQLNEIIDNHDLSYDSLYKHVLDNLTYKISNGFANEQNAGFDISFDGGLSLQSNVEAYLNDVRLNSTNLNLAYNQKYKLRFIANISKDEQVSLKALKPNIYFKYLCTANINYSILILQFRDKCSISTRKAKSNIGFKLQKLLLSDLREIVKKIIKR